MSSSPLSTRVFEAKDVTLTHIATNRTLPISSLYSSSPLVLVFLRRWGCSLCRGYASVLQSQLLPSLTLNSIPAAAVGFERDGADLFSPYFPSTSLYLDPTKAAYTALHLPRFSTLTGLLSLLSSTNRAWHSQVTQMGITGNLKGDGMQLGATYIIGPGGEVWFERVQRDFADHPSVEGAHEGVGGEGAGLCEGEGGGGVWGGWEWGWGRWRGRRGGEGVGEGVVGVGTAPPKKGLEKIGSGGPTCDEACA